MWPILPCGDDGALHIIHLNFRECALMCGEHSHRVSQKEYGAATPLKFLGFLIHLPLRPRWPIATHFGMWGLALLAIL